MDQEYMSLMAELGEGPPPQQVRPISQKLRHFSYLHFQMPSNGAPRNYGSVPSHAQFSTPKAPLAIQGGQMTQGPPSTASSPPGPPPHGWTGNYGGTARPVLRNAAFLERMKKFLLENEAASRRHDNKVCRQGGADLQQGPPPPKGSAPPWMAQGCPPSPSLPLEVLHLLQDIHHHGVAKAVHH